MLLLSLIEIDQSIFHTLNGEWTNAFFDYILPIYRDKYFWLPVYIFIIFFMLYNFGRKSYWFLLSLILCAGVADFTSNTLIKKNVQRIRPCNDASLSDVRELVSCGSGYSFTSNHAANHFAISFFLLLTLGRKYKKLKWIFIFWAISIAYAQVYVGVHFPLDVLSGAILGMLIARFISWMYYNSQRQIDFG